MCVWLCVRVMVLRDFKEATKLTISLKIKKEMCVCLTFEFGASQIHAKSCLEMQDTHSCGETKHNISFYLDAENLT